MIGIGNSESYVPQYCQASTHQASKAHATADRKLVTAADKSKPFPPRPSILRKNGSPSEDNVHPYEDVQSIEQDSAGSPLVGVVIEEPFISVPTRRKSPQPPATPARYKARRSGMPIDQSTQNRISIASSFASNVSLSNLRAPSSNLSLIPDPLRPPNRRPPTIIERSDNRQPRPYPMPISGTYCKSDTHTAKQYTGNRPLRPLSGRHTPTGQNVHGQYDMGSPLSLGSEVFEGSPPATPVVRSRAVTTWGALYDKPALSS